MRILAAVILACLVVGAFVTLGATGIIDMVFTGWATLSAPGTTQ